jgi:hypothetical protein
VPQYGQGTGTTGTKEKDRFLLSSMLSVASDIGSSHVAHFTPKYWVISTSEQQFSADGVAYRLNAVGVQPGLKARLLFALASAPTCVPSLEFLRASNFRTSLQSAPAALLPRAVPFVLGWND